MSIFALSVPIKGIIRTRQKHRNMPICTKTGMPVWPPEQNTAEGGARQHRRRKKGRRKETKKQINIRLISEKL